MSDTRTPQEPGKELKRLVAEIVNRTNNAARAYIKSAEREELFRQIVAEGAQKIENYIQSRIPEASEEARAFANDVYVKTWSRRPPEWRENLAQMIAMRDKGREWKWRDIAEVLVQLKDDGCISHWGPTAAKAFSDARALLSEKS